MGVYIPNMEKPKSCEECLFYELDSIFEDERWSSAPKCLLDGDSDDCPLIETVECKDCKYWADDMSGNMWCEHAIVGLTEANNFCSYGERKEI